MVRFLRNVLIEAVLAGALTSLVLHYVAVGAVLLALGVVMISLTQAGHRIMTFGFTR